MDSRSWDTVLLGYEILSSLNLTPEQHLDTLKGRTFDLSNVHSMHRLEGDQTALMSKLLDTDGSPRPVVGTNPTVGEIVAQNDVNGTMPLEEMELLGIPDQCDFDKVLEEVIQRAKAEGLTHEDKLRKILIKHQKVFALRFEDCEISKLTPLEPKLKPGAEPCFAKPRNMSHKQLVGLQEHINKMVALGMLTKVHNPVWGTPVFVVPKGKDKFRMVADFRAVNARSLKSTLPMPNIEQMVSNVRGSYFASLDNMKGFNLLGLTGNADMLTLVTPFGCYRMNVCPQGYLNSPNVYQDRIVNEVLGPLHLHICVNWVDDCLVYDDTELAFLNSLDKVLTRYAKFNVKLNMQKCEFFTRKVIWCGREFSAAGVKFAAKYYETLNSTPVPTLAVELHDFIYGFQWIQSSLEPMGVIRHKTALLNKLEQLREQVGSRKRKKLEGLPIKLTPAETTAFYGCISLVKNAIGLARVDPLKALCLWTDASDLGCAIIVTQCCPQELSKPIKEQQQEIVFLSSHRFSSAELNWHISSKEALPIIFALKRLDFLFAGNHLNIFMDHRNLEYILHPEKSTNKTTLTRLHRWALELQEHSYTIRHITGEENFFADMFSRWALTQSPLPIVQEASANISRAVQRLQDFNTRNPKQNPRSARRRAIYALPASHGTSLGEGKGDDPENQKQDHPAIVNSNLPITTDTPSDHLANRRALESLTRMLNKLEVPSKEFIRKSQEQARNARPKKAKGQLPTDG